MDTNAIGMLVVIFIREVENRLARGEEGPTTAEEEAWRHLVNHVEDRLLRIVRGMLPRYPGFRGLEESRDVLTTAYLRMHVRREDLFGYLHDTRSSNRRDARVTPGSDNRTLARMFFGWSSQQIRYAVIDMLRRRTTSAEPIPADLPSEDSGFKRHELNVDFYEALSKLNADERELIELHYLQGLTVQEIAVLFACSDDTVYRRMYKVKLKLAESLPGYGTDL